MESLQIQQRPVRLAILVEDQNTEQLLKAVSINTTVWGGIRNPIIPVSEDARHAELLKNFFNPDVLYPVTESDLLKNFSERNWSRRHERLSYTDIFVFDESLDSHRPIFIDALSLIYNLPNMILRRDGSPKLFMLPECNKTHPFATAYAVEYGSYDYLDESVYDYNDAFKKMPSAFKAKLTSDNFQTYSPFSHMTPIHLTNFSLSIARGEHTGIGIFVGSSKSFDDLLSFWNLRAAGYHISFLETSLVRDSIDEALKYVQKIISDAKADAIDCTMYHLYYSSEDESLQRELQKASKLEKPLVLCPISEVSWNGLNVVSSRVATERIQTLGSIVRKIDRATITFAVPESASGLHSLDKDKYIATDVSAFIEYEPPYCTITPPSVPELESYISRELYSAAASIVHANPDSCTFIHRLRDNIQSTTAILLQDICLELLRIWKLNPRFSKAGLLANRLIEKLEGFRNTDILKFRGVRKLIQDLSSGTSARWSNLVSLVVDEGRLSHYEDRFFYRRYVTGEKNVNIILNYLLKRKLIRVGLEIKCLSCGIINWISLANLDNSVNCTYCDFEIIISETLQDESHWKYRKSGLLESGSDTFGTTAVILTLMAFQEMFRGQGFAFCSSVDLDIADDEFELDFLVLLQEAGRTEIGIGEAKTDNSEFKSIDFDRIQKIHDAIEDKRIKLYTVFSRTTEELSEEEIKLFSIHRKSGYRTIILTSKELEDDHPYGSLLRDNPKLRYPASFQDLEINTRILYPKI